MQTTFEILKPFLDQLNDIDANRSIEYLKRVKTQAKKEAWQIKEEKHLERYLTRIQITNNKR